MIYLTHALGLFLGAVWLKGKPWKAVLLWSCEGQDMTAEEGKSVEKKNRLGRGLTVESNSNKAKMA